MFYKLYNLYKMFKLSDFFTKLVLAWCQRTTFFCLCLSLAGTIFTQLNQCAGRKKVNFIINRISSYYKNLNVFSTIRTVTLSLSKGYFHNPVINNFK
uniref:Uncharacterized protein n=1 Tax=Ciona intestinalis TaxID=7719 RepID=H2XPE6_CIOIN